MTALAPSSAALEIASVMPRSLNEPVGLAPSTLRWTSQPVSSESDGRGTSGVPPSRSVTTGCASVDRQPVAVLLDHAAPLGAYGCGCRPVVMLGSPSTRITLVTARTTSSPRSSSTVAGRARRRWRGG